MDVKILVGKRVKELRNKLGLTCEAFGDRLGVSKVSISNLENEKNIISSSDTLINPPV